MISQTGNKVMMIGGQQERQLLDDLKSALPAGVISSEADRSLRETAALIAQCRVWSRRYPRVARCLRSESADRRVARADQCERTRDVWPGRKNCRADWRVSCYLTDCDIDPDCMQLITPERVMTAVEKWL